MYADKLLNLLDPKRNWIKYRWEEGCTEVEPGSNIVFLTDYSESIVSVSTATTSRI